MAPALLGRLMAPTTTARPVPIRVGSLTAERACRVLEQQLGAVWAAVLESHGLDPVQGFRVTLEGLTLVPADDPGVVPAAREPSPDGRPYAER
jgi:hypothetical protein